MQLTVSPHATTAVAPSTPARQLADSLAWLTQPGLTGTYVADVVAVDEQTVHVVVQDPDPRLGDAPTQDALRAADQYIADNASAILRDTVDGVRLVAVTPNGDLGRGGYFSRDEQFFATNIPGVTYQAGESAIETPSGVREVWEFPVVDETAASRIGRIVRDDINGYPVHFDVTGPRWKPEPMGPAT
jgi:hypothetical protein